MIQAFRHNNHVVLEVESESNFEVALIKSTDQHRIELTKQLVTRSGVSRYHLTKPNEGRFSTYLGVVFRRWPRRQAERRVHVELRKMNGTWFRCESTGRQVILQAPSNAVAKVRCGLHAGTYNWRKPVTKLA
jgi:hypothetical protein